MYQYLVSDSVVGVVTCYKLDGLGIDPGGSEIFHTHPEGPPRLLYDGNWVFFFCFGGGGE